MRKLLLVSLISLSGISAVALPATAAESLGTFTCDAVSLNLPDDASMVTSELKREGVNAASLAEWNGCLRVDVKDADGNLHMEFFDPATYQQLPA